MDFSSSCGDEINCGDEIHCGFSKTSSFKIMKSPTVSSPLKPSEILLNL